MHMKSSVQIVVKSIYQPMKSHERIVNQIKQGQLIIGNPKKEILMNLSS